ncbi:MAG: DUF6807 family protein [Thermomicrobiales bacterium]
MITPKVESTAIDFLAGDQLAGRYVFDDEFKPYLHPLNTPRGHTLSLLSPHDHKHHRGLMYGLRARDVCFWEEFTLLPGEVVGRQRHDSLASITGEDGAVGITQELTWLACDDRLITFRERRTITCRSPPEGGAYEWTWSTEIEAQRDVELIMSQWSQRKDDGALVNYHGLGIRFRRDFGCTGGNSLRLDGQKTSFEDGLGTIPAEVEFRGSIDGTWPVQRAAVTLTQFQSNALFVMETPFAFMSLGPNNLAPMQLQQGQRLVERYQVTVIDLPDQERDRGYPLLPHPVRIRRRRWG